jgi:pimeloyl-ACP methyl ester carboxylesterase
MPRPTPKPVKPTKHTPPASSTPEVVDPLWLVKAIAVTIIAALFCGYLTFCLLFYQGQWQLVLHPTRTSAAPASIAGIPYQFIRFGPDESATPQLTGWWIPCSHEARYPNTTILFLPSGDGSLSDSITTLAALHNIGLNVFAFDYRGYGQSSAIHPNQQNLTHDADSAWQYLINSRAIPEQQIVPYGTGVGVSLATQLAANHPAVPALILDAPHTDLLEAAESDPRSRLIPLTFLFHEHFPLAKPLSNLKTPKLLLSRTPSQNLSFRTAADPKLTVEFPSPSAPAYNQSLIRFLDQYLPPRAAPQVVPSAAPAP